jgi:asparaginyl-tRNA synthetase
MNDCEGAGEVFRVIPDQPAAPADTAEGKIPEFFGGPAFLTVSSQLHLEVFSSAFPRVYTLQPAFRAEGSHTSRHLSEFWMLEAEISFVDNLEAIMVSLESSIKHVLAKSTVTLCSLPERLPYFDKVANSPWKRITYTEAVDLIQSSMGDESVKWGDSISTNQERWLADTVSGGLPVFVTDYPADMKPFYMRRNPTNGARQTVACFDLLIPRIGELAGGSMREERLGKIEEAIERFGMDPEQYRWYTELRRFGSAPHGGFGLGFERFISWIGGWENIRECIPAPRWKGRSIL